MSALPYDTSDPGEDWAGDRGVTPDGVTRPVTHPVTFPGVTLTVTPGDDGADAEGNTRALPAAVGSDGALTAAVRPARRLLSSAVGSHHLGGGPDGLAAHLADPSPEPLGTHLRHAGNAIHAARDPGNEHRGTAAAKAAYHILVVIPVKAAAKALTRVAVILDAMPESPPVAILVFVAVAVTAAMIWL